jgi:hypothetical protein
MRNMSFSLTTEQVRRREKTVTRRLGWEDLKPGERVRAVVQGMGLRKGEKVEPICVIEAVSVRREMLCLMPESDCAREGFPQLDAPSFIRMFRAANGCRGDAFVTRIEFRYVDEEVSYGG